MEGTFFFFTKILKYGNSLYPPLGFEKSGGCFCCFCPTELPLSRLAVSLGGTREWKPIVVPQPVSIISPLRVTVWVKDILLYIFHISFESILTE